MYLCVIRIQFDNFALSPELSVSQRMHKKIFVSQPTVLTSAPCMYCMGKTLLAAAMLEDAAERKDWKLSYITQQTLQLYAIHTIINESVKTSAM